MKTHAIASERQHAFHNVVDVNLIVGEKIRIAPRTSKVAIAKAHEHVGQSGMKPLPLHGVEYFDDRVGGQVITSGFGPSNQLHDFSPGFCLFEEHAAHGTRGHGRILLHDATATHASVMCFQDDGGTERLEVRFEIVGDGLGDAFLILQPSCMKVDPTEPVC